MTSTTGERLSGLLHDALGGIGFRETPFAGSDVDDRQAYVAHPLHGIAVLADPDCVRLIVGAHHHGTPEYRMLIPCHARLSPEQAIDIAAHHARLLIRDRS